MSIGESEYGGAWYDYFPFVGKFEHVVERVVSVEYLTQLVCVLEPAVEVFTNTIEERVVNATSVRALFYTVIALARCRAVLPYEREIGDDNVDPDSLLSALRFEWDAMMRTEALVAVDYAPSLGALLGSSVEQVWVNASLNHMYTAKQLLDKYPPFIAAMRVVPSAQVLVVSERGKPLSEVDDEHLDKPVLPADIYRSLLARVKRVGLIGSSASSPETVLQDQVVQLDTGLNVIDSGRVAAWLWLLLSSFGEMQGYCYQQLFPPAERYAACVTLRRRPQVSALLEYVSDRYEAWSVRLAKLDVGVDLHVATGGNLEAEVLQEHIDKRIGTFGAERTSPVVDYYARALVDEFIAKHRPLPAIPDVPPPLDAEFETLSVSTDTSAGREFIDVANMLYAGVNEVVSPRAEGVGASGVGSYGGGDDTISERDSQIVQDVYNRLSDGAVINEEYFRKTYRRFQRFHRRPRLQHSDGKMYHVFEGFPADGGGGTGPWEIDKAWGIPGWQSYVAEFDPGESRTVSFVVEGGCQDVRMDCSGEGALELGDCKLLVRGSLLWFTNSIRLRVVAKDYVCLRVSVPDALSAVAMGAEMRRYMHIPGYAVVVRSYEVINGRVDVTIPMERVKRSSMAGCHIYTGQKYVERGRHRIKLSQLASTAPVKILFKTEPPEALEFVTAGGMRLHPRTRDHVAVLTELRNVEIYVSAVTGATLTVSLVQVVRTKEFELSVVSAQEARNARAVQGV